MGHQLSNMAMLYVLLGLLNRRARRAGDVAARQEEFLLSGVMALAISNLLASLRVDNSQDYVYVSYFLIATTTFLKIRWWAVGGWVGAVGGFGPSVGAVEVRCWSVGWAEDGQQDAVGSVAHPIVALLLRILTIHLPHPPATLLHDMLPS
jgi:hypothetical protein